MCAISTAFNISTSSTNDAIEINIQLSLIKSLCQGFFLVATTLVQSLVFVLNVVCPLMN